MDRLTRLGPWLRDLLALVCTALIVAGVNVVAGTGAALIVAGILGLSILVAVAWIANQEPRT